MLELEDGHLVDPRSSSDSEDLIIRDFGVDLVHSDGGNKSKEWFVCWSQILMAPGVLKQLATRFRKIVC